MMYPRWFEWLVWFGWAVLIVFIVLAFVQPEWVLEGR